MNITIYSHEDCLAHNTGDGHPERRGRLNAVLDTLELSSVADQITYVEAPLGTDRQILLAHSESYLSFVKESSPDSGIVVLDADTVMSSGSLNAALRGVGAACMAVDDLIEDKVNIAFCATRPPGHHATRDRAMGFCIFNNIAIAALYARQCGVEKVAIVDFDVHHGNGTQDIVTGESGVLYISTHESPLYPGTGSENENIEGNILNITLSAGTTSKEYQHIFVERVLPALDEFEPELLLVSGGFDAHRDDLLANLELTEETFKWIGEQLKNVSARYCGKKVLCVLEGGYDLRALSASVVAFLDGLTE